MAEPLGGTTTIESLMGTKSSSISFTADADGIVWGERYVHGVLEKVALYKVTHERSE